MPIPEGERVRRFFVTPEIDALLSGETQSEPMFPCALADVVIGRFVKGWLVSCTRKSTSKADFKILKSLDEAWSVTMPGPAAGWRIFGRFARKNVFVGISAWDRDNCSPFAVYNQRAAEMIAEWNSRFVKEPLRAPAFQAYFGDNFRDVDDND